MLVRILYFSKDKTMETVETMETTCLKIDDHLYVFKCYSCTIRTNSFLFIQIFNDYLV